MAKKRFFTEHSKSSAIFVSLAMHAILIAIAVTFVVVSVIPKKESAFEVKKVKRPKMPLKKIKVPVDTKKRKPKPRLRKRIVSTKKTFTEIKMPEITGVKGGLGNMGGDGLGSLGFDLDMDLFGGNRSMGDELEGTFYDLKHTDEGKLTQIGRTRGMNAINLFYEELAKFSSSWKTKRLNEYFQAPRKKYATFFMIPMLKSEQATKAFGVDDTVKPNFWVAYYEGHIAAPRSGHYRFHGYGDDILLVRINKRLVLDAGYEDYRPKLSTNWRSDDKDNRKHPIGWKRDLLYVGDWFKLTKGQPVRMEVLIGDVGYECSSHLLIEERGATYEQVPSSSGTRPVLPLFKTREIPKDLHEDMKLNPKEVTLEGPSFGAASK